MISEQQKELGWGKSVVQKISDDLRFEFPDHKGVSTSNLWMMVQFFEEYRDDMNLQTLSGEIGFSHNILILSNCKSRSERLFYLNSTIKFGWSFRILDHQIDNKTYEKHLLNQTNYDDLPAEKFENQKILAIKYHYCYSIGNCNVW
jgi:predicted nuclease of restriction endonuclease-like (RecB) superfamily